MTSISRNKKALNCFVSGLQKRKNIVLFDDALNSTTVYDCDYNSQGTHIPILYILYTQDVR